MNWKVAGQILLCSISLLFSSCSDAPPKDQQEEVTAEFDQLDAILKAYMAYTSTNDKPPTSSEDLGKHFDEGVDKAKVFQSTRDGQSYVIHWGIDVRQLSGQLPLVLAYEKVGKNDKRLVLTAFGVVEMNLAQFRAANFPEGKRP